MLQNALNEMLLSASGWRKVFAPDGEYGMGSQPVIADCLLATGMGLIWGQWLQHNVCLVPTVVVANDTRPTGPIIAEMIIRGLEHSGCTVKHAGVAAAPELMARSAQDDRIDGFAYVSASHNPVGHNGLKFGIGGGVIGGSDARRLIEDFREMLMRPNAQQFLADIAHISRESAAILPRSPEKNEKKICLKMYLDLLKDIAGGDGVGEVKNTTWKTLRRAILQTPIGVIADLNGSARCHSIDRDYFTELGVKFESFNAIAGEISHAILPEGHALEPCRLALEKAHAQDAAFLIGYVPDNDGDRGNLVIWDEVAGLARSLEAQEVFALAVLAELAAANWTNQIHGLPAALSALVVNGPTSHRVRLIADAYGVEVHEAEVGEANLVNRAVELRQSGYHVRLLGEGSNGGTIMHPAAVRDPLNTITSLIKLLRLPSVSGVPGLFADWCRRIDWENTPNFGPAHIVASLPIFSTTPASDCAAVMHIHTSDHATLKSIWEEIFQEQWMRHYDEFVQRFGFVKWYEVNNEGTISRQGCGPEYRSQKQRGGLKIVFVDTEGRDAGFIWMRGSGTEPVFRVMAEVRGGEKDKERALLDWHRQIVTAADLRATGKPVDISRIHIGLIE